MSTPAFTYHASAQTSFKPPLIANENAFLGDIATSEKEDAEKPISAGFYRLEKGQPCHCLFPKSSASSLCSSMCFHLPNERSYSSPPLVVLHP